MHLLFRIEYGSERQISMAPLLTCAHLARSDFRQLDTVVTVPYCVFF